MTFRFSAKNKLSAIIVTLALFFVAFPPSARAHVPLLETDRGQFQSLSTLDFSQAQPVADPTAQSAAVYGRLRQPGEVDLYQFSASATGVMPVELLVPAWPGAGRFYPELLIIGPGVGARIGRDLPPELPLPKGLTGFAANNQLLGKRRLMFEPYSLERLYRGEAIELEVEAGHVYYLAVHQPSGGSGAYSLAFGAKENFKGQSWGRVISSVALMKLGLVDFSKLPWLDLAAWSAIWLGLVWLFSAARQLYLSGSLMADPAGLETLFRQSRKSAWSAFLSGFGLWLVAQLCFNRVGWLSAVAFFEAIAALLLVLSFIDLAGGFRSDWWLVKRPGSNQSQVRRPRRFRFSYRFYQLSWLVLFVAALWRLFVL